MDAKNKKLLLIYILLFIAMNIFNAMSVTISHFNKYIISFDFNFWGSVNSIVGNFGVLLLIMCIGFLFIRKRNGSYIYLIVVSFLLNLAVLSIFLFTRYYSTVFSFTLDVFSNPGNGLVWPIIGQTIREIFMKGKILYFAPTVILAGYYFIISKKNPENPLRKPTRYFEINGIINSVLICFLSFFALCFLINKSPDASADVHLFGVRNGGLYNYYLSELLGVKYKATETTEKPLDEEVIMNGLIEEYNRNKDKYINLIDNKEYQRDNKLTGLLSGYNVFIIQLESHNNFFINKTINGIEVTPFLNRLAQEEFYFSNVMTSVGIGNTSDAEFSVLTGLYPNGDSSIYWDFNDANYDFETLPKIFGTKNYITSSYHGNVKKFYNRENAHTKMLGFDSFKALEEYVSIYPMETYPQNYYNSWVSDKEVLRWSYSEALSKIQSNNKFFNFNVLLQPHTPYASPEDVSFDWGKEYNKTQLAYYLDNIKNQDAALEEFMSMAMQNLPNTLFVLYGDHGCGIYDEELLSLFNINKGIEQRELLTQIPVFFIDSSKALNKMISKNEFSQIANLVRSERDIYRSIINLVGLYDECQYIFGCDMFSSEPSFAYDAKNTDYKTDRVYSNIRTINSLIYYDGAISDKELKNLQTFIKKYKMVNNYFLSKQIKYQSID